jgi:hypothetical protein
MAEELESLVGDDLDELPTDRIEAKEFVQRFKRNHPPGTTTDTYVVYAVCAFRDHIKEHFGPVLKTRCERIFPAGSNGIRVYKGTNLLSLRVHFLVFTAPNPQDPEDGIPIDMLDHVHRLHNLSFDLDDVAKGKHGFTNHIVCQPQCPPGDSLYS